MGVESENALTVCCGDQINSMASELRLGGGSLFHFCPNVERTALQPLRLTSPVTVFCCNANCSTERGRGERERGGGGEKV